MLNKDVCKKCLNATPVPWSKQDEYAWENGLVTCPGHRSTQLHRDLYVFRKVSNYSYECPYKAEHLILDNMNDTTKTTQSI